MTRRVLVALLVIVVAVAGAAWLTTPGVGDLQARVAARERATAVHPVALARISHYLREAVVATEDERFYTNHGIDVLGLARAIPYDLAHLSFSQGGSTITDQLAKLLYLGGNDHSPWRKLQDLTLALRISTTYSKERVLDAYLNSVYLGSGAYGVRAAAKRYFGVPPSRLGLGRSSLLAGLIQAPTAYDPLTNPLAARWRQVDVLRSLVRNGYATTAQAEQVVAQPLALRGGRSLPPLRGVSFASRPAFSLGPLALGVAVLAAAVGGFLLLRPRTRGHWVAGALVRIAAAAAAIVAAITITSSFNAL